MACHFFARYIVQFRTTRTYVIGLHPLFKDVSMLLQFFFVCIFHCQISHFSPVILHIKELLTVSSFIIKNIFVMFTAYYPASCFASVELCLGDYIFLMWFLRISFFYNFAERFSGCTLRHLSACPVAYGSKEIYAVANELGEYFTCILLVGQCDDKWNIYNLLI